MNPFLSHRNAISGLIVLATAVAVIWFFRGDLLDTQPAAPVDKVSGSGAPAEEQSVLEISAQARKNLGLVAAAATPQEYWRSVTIPGLVADRPGVSDRSVTSPAVGVVTAIHAFPGDTMRPGDALFTLRLFSEYLQNTQAQLFKAQQETGIIQAEIDRLSEAARTGAVSKATMLALQADLSRQRAIIQAARQDLLTRGLRPQQVEQVQQNGEFVSTIEVTAPPPVADFARGESMPPQAVIQTSHLAPDNVAYEVQELNVEMGQQVQAGQLLAKLSNHQLLYVIGHAFKREAAYLEHVAAEGRELDIEFTEDNQERWSPVAQSFQIRHLSNSIDPESRTFEFFVPLHNQSHLYEKPEGRFLTWRYRPGQRARIRVPVERFENVFVLPADAVVREGPEAYVFRQNGDLFKRISVHVLHEDRQNVVLANDGSITTGSYLAQNSAASLLRVLKAQSASGMQPGLHVHPDGTTHAAH